MNTGADGDGGGREAATERRERECAKRFAENRAARLRQGIFRQRERASAATRRKAGTQLLSISESISIRTRKAESDERTKNSYAPRGRNSQRNNRRFGNFSIPACGGNGHSARADFGHNPRAQRHHARDSVASFGVSRLFVRLLAESSAAGRCRTRPRGSCARARENRALPRIVASRASAPPSRRRSGASVRQGDAKRRERRRPRRRRLGFFMRTEQESESEI